MEALSKEEENKIHNRQVAKEGSWIHTLFEEAGLKLKDKQEIWKRLGQDTEKNDRKIKSLEK